MKTKEVDKGGQKKIEDKKRGRKKKTREDDET